MSLLSTVFYGSWEKNSEKMFQPLAKQIHLMTRSILFLLLAWLAFSLALIFLVIGAFLYLTHYSEPGLAAFWVSGISFILSLLILGLGWQRLKS